MTPLGLPILMLLSCGDTGGDGDAPDPSAGTDQAGRLVEALAEKDLNPNGASGLCLTLVDRETALGCVEEVASAQATYDVKGALESCEKIRARRPAWSEQDGECFFRVAERSNEGWICEHAREFAFDCRMHVFSNGLRSWIPGGSGPGDFEARASAEIEAAGLDPYDARPWSAMYRWVLGGQRPLDRGSCDGAPDSFRQESCRATAVAVLHDRLSHGRDRGWPLCEGVLPEPIRFEADPVLDEALTERRADDLCDPSKRRAAPDGNQLPGSGP